MNDKNVLSFFFPLNIVRYILYCARTPVLKSLVFFFFFQYCREGEIFVLSSLCPTDPFRSFTPSVLPWLLLRLTTTAAAHAHTPALDEYTRANDDVTPRRIIKLKD